MSAEAVGWVYRYSPYRGALFQLHHAIADSANDQNDFLVWLGVKKSATKARIETRSVINGYKRFTQDGFLELIDGQHGQLGGATYRMLFPKVSVVYDSLEGRSTSAKRSLVQSTTSAIDDNNRCNPRRPLVQSTATAPIYELNELKEPKRVPASPLTRFEPEFEILWKIVPKRNVNGNHDSRLKAFKAYSSLRKKKITAEELLTATQNYAKARTGQDPDFNMSAARFYGPNEEWRPYLESASAPTLQACPDCGCIGNHLPDCSLKGS